MSGGTNVDVTKTMNTTVPDLRGSGLPDDPSVNLPTSSMENQGGTNPHIEDTSEGEQETSEGEPDVEWLTVEDPSPDDADGEYPGVEKSSMKEGSIIAMLSLGEQRAAKSSVENSSVEEGSAVEKDWRIEDWIVKDCIVEDSSAEEPTVEEQGVEVQNADDTTTEFKNALTSGSRSRQEPLQPEDQDLANLEPAVVMRRLVWTPITSYLALKSRQTDNSGLRIAFSKANAPLLCNMAICRQFPLQTAYLGLDLAESLYTKWLLPTGVQARSLKGIETAWLLERKDTLKVAPDDHGYAVGIGFTTPGPGLLYGLEMGLVSVQQLSIHNNGEVVAVEREVAIKCLDDINAPWYVKAKGYGSYVLPRASASAMAWYYD